MTLVQTLQKVLWLVARECPLLMQLNLTNILKRSSGATATITVSHLWRDEGLTPPLTGLHLAVPAPCIISALPEKYREKEKSWEQNKDAPVFNQDTSNFLAREYPSSISDLVAPS